MKYKYFAFVTLIVALGFVVVYSPVASQPESESLFISTNDTVLNDTQISWTPDIAYSGASLVVGGEAEFVAEATFGAGEALVYDVAGLTDGGYTFEWRLEPLVDAAVLAELTSLDSDGRGERVAELQAAGVLPELDQVVQSGYFTILNGLIVLDTSEGGSLDGVATDMAPADIVQNDDLIVTFSACVGNDCVNGENFGFDTIRVKENNLRIHFDDTSNSASFPANDWRLVANDTNNGGASYFAIEDATAGRIPFRVEAGAPANSLYVEADGDVGIKTANPVVDVHIIEGNTPTVRLEQDGSDGFTAQTYDIAANEANFFIRDVTNGSSLFFRAKPGAPEDSIFIAADGDIGLGTDAPQGQLHVRNSDGSSTMLFNNGNLTISGILLEASDKNLKENFAPVEPQTVLAQIVQMPLSMWNYISDENDTVHMGPMAQDFYAAFGLGSSDKHIAPLDANGVAFAGIQGLFELFQTHDGELEALEQENEELKARVEDLEAAVDALLKAQEAQGE